MGTKLQCLISHLMPFVKVMFQHFSELGPGWEITRLNDDNELDFIQDVTRDLYSRRRRFWIGGSTDVDVGERVTYENYSTTDCGKALLVSLNSTVKVNKI